MKIHKYIIAAFVIHILIALLMRYDVIPGIENQQWLFKHGSDKNSYFNVAKGFANFEFREGQHPIGLSFFLSLFIFVFSAERFYDVLLPVLFVYNLVLYPIFLFFLFNIILRITSNEKIAKYSVIVYSIFPLLLYIIVSFLKNSYLAGIYMGREMWLVALSEPLSLFLNFWILYKMTHKESIQTKSDAVKLGILFSVSVLVRTINILSAVMFVPLLVDKKFKKIIVIAVTAFVVYIPQLYYNYVFTDDPFRATYYNQWTHMKGTNKQLYEKNGMVSLQNMKFFYGKLKKNIPFFYVFLGITLFIWFVCIYNCNRAQIPFQLYTISFLFFYACFLFTYQNVTRFFSAIFPCLIFIYMYGTEKIVEWIRK